MDLVLLIAVVALGVVTYRARREIEGLQARLGALEGRLRGAPEAVTAESPTAPASTVPDPAPAEAEAPAPAGPWQQAAPEPDEPAPPSSPQPKKAGPPRNWEHLLGVRLPVWGGAALLLFAAFLFANYAVEQGIFTPLVRVWAAGLGAAGLLAAAFAVRALRIANFERIGSALTAAAIGLGYATCYMATSVFGFWSPFWGAIGCGVVALMAIAMALSFGQLVLVLGLLGGYFAPAALDGSGDEWSLLGYLVMVLVASHAVAAARGWWMGALASMALALLWAMGWHWLAGPAADIMPLTLWLLAITAVPVVAELLAPFDAREEGKSAPMRRGGPIAAAAAVAVLLVLFGRSAPPEAAFWPGFVAWLAFLTAASLLRPRRAIHGMVAAGGLIGALILWRDPEPAARLGVLIAGVPLCLAGVALHIRAGRSPGLWASLGTALLMVWVLTSLVDFDGWAGARDVPYVWAAVCIGLAGAVAGIIYALRGSDVLEGIAPPLSAGASGLMSIAIGLVVDPGYYALSAALQVTGLGLVFLRYRMRTLLYLGLIYGMAALALAGLGHVLAVDGGWAAALPYGRFVPVMAVDAAPWTSLVLPGLALLTGATLFATGGPDRLIDALDLGGVFALALGLHLVAVPLLAGEPVRNIMVYGALAFPIELGLAAAAVALGMRFAREGLVVSGLVVTVAFALVLVQFVLAPIARLWPEMVIPGIAFFNLATVALGSAAALFFVSGWLIKPRGGDLHRYAAVGLQAFSGLVVFAWMLLTIRHGFHPDLLQGETGGVERYGYTAGMLGFAFALLWLGTLRDNQAVRIASLGVALATVGKLFVFDMGGLTGLWRIGSFLGLGLALLAVSWFYARFVFGVGARFEPGGGPQPEQA